MDLGSRFNYLLHSSLKKILVGISVCLQSHVNNISLGVDNTVKP